MLRDRRVRATLPVIEEAMAVADWPRDADVLVSGRLVRMSRLHADGIDSVEDPQQAIAGINAQGRRADIFTFVQTLPDTQPRFSYPMEWDNFAALPVSTFDHWWSKQVDFRVRNKVRKAEKNGLSVGEVVLDRRLVHGLSAIYNESPVRQGRPFWHYGEDLDTVQRQNATFPDRSILIGAYLETRLVGFMRMVVDRRGLQAGVVQIISTLADRDKAPTNALIAQAVRACAARQIPHLVYSSFSYGKSQDSLADFKRHNGFQRIDMPRYFVPLTLWGRGALRLGLHHRLRDRIPEGVGARLRVARSSWYEFRYNRQQRAAPSHGG